VQSEYQILAHLARPGRTSRRQIARGTVNLLQRIIRANQALERAVSRHTLCGTPPPWVARRPLEGVLVLPKRYEERLSSPRA
jgi:hypothetical protein